MRRTIVSLVVAALVVVSVGCATNGGSRAKFCAALPHTSNLLSILTDFSSTDPAALQKRFAAGLAQYEQLQKDAPASIRGDVATVTDTIERILAVVQAHPDDLSAIRTDLTNSAASFASAGTAASNIANYARTKCGIDISSGASALLDQPGGSPTTTTTTSP